MRLQPMVWDNTLFAKDGLQILLIKEYLVRAPGAENWKREEIEHFEKTADLSKLQPARSDVSVYYFTDEMRKRFEKNSELCAQIARPGAKVHGEARLDLRKSRKK